MTETLQSLLDRVLAATGADRVVDVDLAEMFEPCCEPDCLLDVRARNHARVRAGGEDWEVTPYTASLDAALALVGRCLPGWLWDVTTITTSIGGKSEPGALVVAPDHPPCAEIKAHGSAATPSLALLAALLKALIAKDDRS